MQPDHACSPRARAASHPATAARVAAATGTAISGRSRAPVRRCTPRPRMVESTTHEASQPMPSAATPTPRSGTSRYPGCRRCDGRSQRRRRVAQRVQRAGRRNGDRSTEDESRTSPGNHRPGRLPTGAEQHRDKDLCGRSQRRQHQARGNCSHARGALDGRPQLSSRSNEPCRRGIGHTPNASKSSMGTPSTCRARAHCPSALSGDRDRPGVEALIASEVRDLCRLEP